MNIEFLLAEISEISKKYSLINQKTGGHFNIFEIAGINSDEVKICKVLYELLNPQGSHFQGYTYLKLFVENVLHFDFSDSEYQDAKVYQEYVIDGDRRIDLVIEIADKFIPIEVKIYAGEQHNQCFDYYQRAQNSNLFYLTLFGTPPSDYSAHGLTKEDEGYKEVTQISFENDILIWLEKCLEDQNTIKIAPVREVLLQLISVIRGLTNQMEENQEMEIVKMLSSKEENMKSAVEIEKSLKTCKLEIIKKVLNAIEERINKEKLLNKYDYEYNNYNLSNSFYDKKESSYPGISYFCKSLNKSGVDLWLRIEIDHQLFVGYCTPLNGQQQGNQQNKDEIKQILWNIDPRVDAWWVYSELLPENDENDSPNFKEFNEKYFDLFDEEKFNIFINQCIESIEKMWKCCSNEQNTETKHL